MNTKLNPPRLVGEVTEVRPGVFGLVAMPQLDSDKPTKNYHPFGQFQRIDIGKRVYTGRGVLTMENDEQLQRRRLASASAAGVLDCLRKLG